MELVAFYLCMLNTDLNYPAKNVSCFKSDFYILFYQSIKCKLSCVAPTSGDGVFVVFLAWIVTA